MDAAKLSTVKTAILTALAGLESGATLKKNKLRKIVCEKTCKSLKVLWDEYDLVVKNLVDEKKVRETIEEDGEGSSAFLQLRSSKSSSSSAKSSSVTEPSPSSSSFSSASSASSAAKPPATSSSESSTGTSNASSSSSSSSPPSPAAAAAAPAHSTTVTIPTLIALHLLKDKCLKQKNIEVNTKTVLKVVGDTSDANRKPTDTVKLVVSSAPGATEPEKRVAAAMVFIKRFDFAKNLNPGKFGFPGERKTPEGSKGGDKDKREAEKTEEKGAKKQRKFF